MSAIAPRFRGRAFQKPSRAWCWELIISIGPDSEDAPEPLCYQSKQDFLNKDSALISLREAVPGLMEAVAHALGQEASGVIDLKAGESMSIQEWTDRGHR